MHRSKNFHIVISLKKKNWNSGYIKELPGNASNSWIGRTPSQGIGRTGAENQSRAPNRTWVKKGMYFNLFFLSLQQHLMSTRLGSLLPSIPPPFYISNWWLALKIILHACCSCCCCCCCCCCCYSERNTWVGDTTGKPREWREALDVLAHHSHMFNTVPL